MPGSGYATISRKKILEFLKKNSDRTVAVADIDHYLKAQDCEVNITTIYRYLDKLAKDGTVIKYVAEKGNQAVYQYVELGHHCEEHLHLSNLNNSSRSNTYFKLFFLYKHYYIPIFPTSCDINSMYSLIFTFFRF